MTFPISQEAVISPWLRSLCGCHWHRRPCPGSDRKTWLSNTVLRWSLCYLFILYSSFKLIFLMKFITNIETNGLACLHWCVFVSMTCWPWLPQQGITCTIDQMRGDEKSWQETSSDLEHTHTHTTRAHSSRQWGYLRSGGIVRYVWGVHTLSNLIWGRLTLRSPAAQWWHLSDQS